MTEQEPPKLKPLAPPAALPLSTNAWIDMARARVELERAESQMMFVAVTAGTTLAKELQEQGWRLACDESMGFNPDGSFRVKYTWTWVAPDETPGVQSEDGEEELT